MLAFDFPYFTQERIFAGSIQTIFLEKILRLTCCFERNLSNKPYSDGGLWLRETGGRDGKQFTKTATIS